MKKFGLRKALSNVWGGGASRIAIIVALVMALGCLVACSTPNNGPKIVSTWKYEGITDGSSDGSSYTIILTFMDDNSWSIKQTTTIKAEPESHIMTVNESGTYTGDASKDGEIELTVKDISVDMNDAMKDMYEEIGVDINVYIAQWDTVKGQKTQGIINGNELTFSENIDGETFTVTYTKQ